MYKVLDYKEVLFKKGGKLEVGKYTKLENIETKEVKIVDYYGYLKLKLERRIEGEW